jgi:hypothetical protein
MNVLTGFYFGLGLILAFLAASAAVIAIFWIIKKIEGS